MPNFTVIGVRKPAPLMVMAEPCAPLGGDRLSMFGLTVNLLVEVKLLVVKLEPELGLPEAVTTVIVPVVAADGTLATICVSELITKLPLTLTPLNCTSVAAASPILAVMVMASPSMPLVGLNDRPLPPKFCAKVARLGEPQPLTSS